MIEAGIVIIRPERIAAWGEIMVAAMKMAATEAMIASEATCIAYETLQDHKRQLPLLTPMSEVAGRMSIQEGAKFLERPQMGRGILLGGVPGVAPAHITILGGGVVVVVNNYRDDPMSHCCQNLSWQ